MELYGQQESQINDCHSEKSKQMNSGNVPAIFSGMLGSTNNDVLQHQIITNSLTNDKSEDFKNLLLENIVLKKKIKEITVDRDRLLFILSSHGLELSTFENEHLQSFPPKIVDLNSSNEQSISPDTSSFYSADNNSRLYLQQNKSASKHASLNNKHANNLLSNALPPYQLPDQAICLHQSHQLSNQHGENNDCIFQDSQLIYFQQNRHLLPNYHPQHASNIATDNGLQQSLYKKNTIRNGCDVSKRIRSQTVYELSQDLLEKKIELLERKYGGVRARNAAITIQRAFRHYMMVKKFASITAMAKAEKRLSNRVIAAGRDEGIIANSLLTSSTNTCLNDIQVDLPQSNKCIQQPRVTIMAGPHSYVVGALRQTPMRSLSMREKRQIETNFLPRSISSFSSNNSIAASYTYNTTLSHPYVNLLHATEPRSYLPQNSLQSEVQKSDISSNLLEPFYSNESASNSSWNHTSGPTPHTPYYSAAQIYMRPKNITVFSNGKKVPPEVPKRTSSIALQQQSHQQNFQHQQQQTPFTGRQISQSTSLMRSSNNLCKSSENGSLTSVQSSGSDSSTSATFGERIIINDLYSERSGSPCAWKQVSNLNNSQNFIHPSDLYFPIANVANDSVNILDDNRISSHKSAAQYEQQEHQENQFINSSAPVQNCKISETLRKRQYRVGLNLFNKKPEKGITYLIRRGLLENSPQGVARFLITRKGLSRQMIGEYLGNLQNQFNMAVLDSFALELDLSGMQVDVALRKFQTYFRMPGEAQKIERLMEIFSNRYCQCNQDIIGRLRSTDTIFVLAFAIIMLNTDLHTPSLKPERRMRVEDFIKNLRGIDDCHDIDNDMLAGIYARVKANEFKPGSDHVTQVMKVQATIAGKKPNLALPHRRLVCYCRLYEIPDVNKKERPGVHQREVFLFNDLLVITKIFNKKKSSLTYTFRNSFPLCGMVVTLLNSTNYQFCIQLSQKVDGKILITFNARNEHDRCKFAEDLKEYISEMDEMETLRIEAELERQKTARSRATSNSENRDSGVVDVEVCAGAFQVPQIRNQATGNLDLSSQQLKRTALSNSLLDIHEQVGSEKSQRRGSVGSLDSGMSISFQSTTVSNNSHDTAGIITSGMNSANVRYSFPNVTTVDNTRPSSTIQGCQQKHCTIIQQNNCAQHSVAKTKNIFGEQERKINHTDDNGKSTEV